MLYHNAIYDIGLEILHVISEMPYIYDSRSEMPHVIPDMPYAISGQKSCLLYQNDIHDIRSEILHVISEMQYVISVQKCRLQYHFRNTICYIRQEPLHVRLVKTCCMVYYINITLFMG